MDLVYHFAQTSPRLAPIYAFLFGLITMDHYVVLLGIFSFVDIIINLIIKYIFRKLYEYLKVKKLPLLGIGERPSGKCNDTDLGFFNKYLKIKEAKLFGMPSGHSQSAWFIFTFVLLYLIDVLKLNNSNSSSSYESKKNWITYTIILLFIITVFISYSRIKENCHTIEQVLLGSFIGAVLGFIFYNISKIIIKGNL
jgi:membrane-associated phospholipid phosphatase